MSATSMEGKTAIVFGGTGFVGAHVVEKLAREGASVRIASRTPKSAYYLRPCGLPGQVESFFCDYTARSLNDALKRADYVVNCVGAIYETRKTTFEKTHVELPARIAKACAKQGVQHFVHISALAVDTAQSVYAKTKLAGERRILSAFPEAVILRPSVIFGPKDSFFNMFSALSRFLPVFPLIGGGKTKFQPVYAGDVARAVIESFKDLKAKGQVYELGGPEILSFKEIYERLFKYTGRKTVLCPLPWWVAKSQAFFMEFMPTPLLTRDQVESLKTANIVGKGARSFDDLGIHPTALAAVLPRYL